MSESDLPIKDDPVNSSSRDAIKELPKTMGLAPASTWGGTPSYVRPRSDQASAHIEEAGHDAPAGPSLLPDAVQRAAVALGVAPASIWGGAPSHAGARSGPASGPIDEARRSATTGPSSLVDAIERVTAAMEIAPLTGNVATHINGDALGELPNQSIPKKPDVGVNKTR